MAISPSGPLTSLNTEETKTLTVQAGVDGASSRIPLITGVTAGSLSYSVNFANPSTTIATITSSAITNSTSTIPPANNPSDVKIIVGGLVAGFGGAILLSTLVLICVRKRKARGAILSASAPEADTETPLDLPTPAIVHLPPHEPGSLHEKPPQEEFQADYEPVDDQPPQYSTTQNPSAVGGRRHGRRIARDGGVRIDHGPGVQEILRRQQSVRSVTTEFSVGTLPSTSASTLPPPYGRYY